MIFCDKDCERCEYYGKCSKGEDKTLFWNE